MAEESVPGEDGRGDAGARFELKWEEPLTGWSGGTGRRTGLKIPRPSLGMWVRPPPPAPESCYRNSLALRHFRGQPRSQEQLTTQHLHTLTVVFEVAEAERLSAYGLHFVVESFGDPIGFGEAPHAGDLFSPGVERVAQSDHLRQSRVPQLGYGTEKSWNEFLALLSSLVLLQKQVAEALFEAVR